MLEKICQKAFAKSLWAYHTNTRACNGCDIEVICVLTSYYDAERFGIKLVGSPRHADVLLVSGPVTRQVAPAIRKLYEAIPNPKLVIAIGSCPTGGNMWFDSGMRMIAIGVGGLDAATVMGGAPFELTMPKVLRVHLLGRLKRPYVSAMDVILEILGRLTVKGGVGKVLEYGGPGVRDLNVTERATITNMGAELGATTSIFPSDERTKFYLAAVGREGDWTELSADEDASYAEVIKINLGTIEPMIAQPHSPDNVVTVKSLSGTRVNQVCIGSCTNSSYQALKSVASILKADPSIIPCGTGKHPVSFVWSPG